MSDDLQIDKQGDYACVHIRLQPRASRNEVCGTVGSELKVRVTSPPVDDRANAQLIEFLAQVVGLARRDVAILKGHKSRRKIVGFKDISPDDLARRLRNI